MSEKKSRWKGIQFQQVIIQGEVPLDPVFSGDYAFFNVATLAKTMDANGQIVDLPQEIPIMVEPGPKVAVVKNHIKAQRQLMVVGHYKSWNVGGSPQHAIVADIIKLGHSPFQGDQSNEANVPLPPG
jgi:hypothetical protein